ncbi:hypothetical protein AX774_g989 [Zancudomyces culisetae]|uniref:Uncharacterized protein n=1 Tax=Zancudomyces culisetae TaxID=1213189 RepID=A0A1R1PWT6_ZANCU|nr:hypothetical protein AX774_g989 [Zancudomyces culisetae]|eukprot:OMH85460.1 hypothetical protein AX774_g989 [Zancudomyces culisetae]
MKTVIISAILAVTAFASQQGNNYNCNNHCDQDIAENNDYSPENYQDEYAPNVMQDAQVNSLPGHYCYHKHIGGGKFLFKSTISEKSVLVFLKKFIISLRTEQGLLG